MRLAEKRSVSAVVCALHQLAILLGEHFRNDLHLLAALEILERRRRREA